MRTIQRYHRSGWLVGWIVFVTLLISLTNPRHLGLLAASLAQTTSTPPVIGKPTLTPTLFTTPIILSPATPTHTATGHPATPSGATSTSTPSPTLQQTPPESGKPTLTPTSPSTVSPQATETVVSRETATPLSLPTSTPTATEEHFFYLPSVIREELSVIVQGSVKQNGLAVNQLPVILMATDGVIERVQQSTLTRLDGSYQFLRVAMPESGFTYYVRYNNETSTAGRIEHWETPRLGGMEMGRTYTFSPFDIADVALRTPPDGVTVGFPVTFRWTKRSGSPSDLYVVHLYSPAEQFATESNPFGYNPEQGTISCLPSPNPGFIPSATYRWRIRIQSPDGGTGYSIGTRGISFSWIEPC